MPANELLRRVVVGERAIEYTSRPSATARQIRVRVGPRGVEVVHPTGRPAADIDDFLIQNTKWLDHQLDRVEGLAKVHLRQLVNRGQLLVRGEPRVVRIEEHALRRRTRVVQEGATVRVLMGRGSSTSPSRALENWLRRLARADVGEYLFEVSQRLGCHPGRIYIMDQRTKWGNCSAAANLSFNWRLVMAPPYVLRYLVTHEAAHLIVPDHSARFWLTVQSHCQETEQARRWLVANETLLRADLDRFSSHWAR